MCPELQEDWQLADDVEVRSLPTSFHAGMGATTPAQVNAVTEIVGKMSDELDTLQNDLKDLAAIGLASPVVYR
jgi:hypothetical protein